MTDTMRPPRHMEPLVPTTAMGSRGGAVNEIGTTVVEATIAAHWELGPGSLEIVHEVILARELQDRELEKRDPRSIP